MRLYRIAAVCLVALLSIQMALLTAPARAGIIDLDDFGTSFFAFPGTNPATVSYDAITDEFAIEQTLTSAFPYSFSNSLGLGTSTLIADDVIGAFSLSATIDGTGNFSGGAFSLVGESLTLGISAGTTLIAGNLQGFFNGLGTSLNGVDFLSKPNLVDSALESAVGPINTLFIQTIFIGAPDFGSSFGPSDTAASSPVLFGTALQIPEPGTLSLFLLGLAGLWMLRSARTA